MAKGARIAKELVIRTTNRVGLLADVARLLADMGINILAVNTWTQGDEAEIHLLTDAQLYARDALRDAEYPVEQREVVVLELPHRPGFLRRITEILRRKGLDIHYLYSTAPDWSERSLIILSCDNNGKALVLLREA